MDRSLSSMFENEDAPPAIRASYAVLFAVSAGGPGGITADSIVRITGQGKRMVYRNLKSLRALGLIEPAQENSRYRIGPVAASLAVSSASQRLFLERAQHVADEVTELTGEPAHVTVYDHGTSVTVAAASATTVHSEYRVPIIVGSRRPAHASASGKIFLAYSNAARAAYLLRPLEAFTECTITDPAAFAEHCRIISQRGWSTDLQENTLGVTCIAVPVWGLRERVAASIVVSTGKPEMPESTKQELLAHLLPAAKEFSRNIGGQ